MARITIDSINENLSEENWKCVSDTYKNLDSELHFICNEGHDVYSSWKKIRAKRKCPICEKNKFINKDVKVIPKSGAKRVLALDQSSHITGWAVLDDGILTDFGVFDCGTGDEGERAHKLRMWFYSMAQNWKPDFVGFEGIQYQETSDGNKNKKMGITVFQTLARIQGVLMEASCALNIPYMWCPTNAWRKHLGVKGLHRTDRKRSMQNIVKNIFDITVTDDVADAIGIGKYLSDSTIKVEQWD